MRFKRVGVFCLLLFCFSALVETKAQGVVVPIICDQRPCRPRPRPLPQPLPVVLPIKSIKIDAKINGQVATTHVEQVFRNDTPYTLEGTYFFPIPETASIVEFAIWENGKKLVGEVRSREEARRIYDEIVRRQRDPGLLEYAGKDLFQASIFPIPPNSDKKLEITYSQVLKAEAGTVGYRYPLGMGNRAWVNRPPNAVPVRNASMSGNRPEQLGIVSGRVEITGQQALRGVYSPSHLIDVDRNGENRAVLTFESKNKTEDFQLFYGLSEKDFGLSLVTYREPGKDGYFLLILSPKDKILENEIAAKDIVFVLDTSGSMADEGKMEKARAALLFGVRNLRDADRFNIINFAGEEHLMESGLIRADAAGKRRGEEFVKKLEPRGGTNINDALRAALKQFDRSERPKMLVFMTDGLPTVGETNVEKIIKNANETKVEGLRLFTFGVGYDVNTLLLDKIAAENSGTAEYVEPKEDLEVKVSAFFTKVNSPVLTGIELDFDRAQTDYIYPRKMPDLFRGSQLTILGRYKNAADLKDLTLRLTGKTGRENRTFSYENLSFPLRAEENDFLPRLWATRRVGWLMEQIRANGEQKELRDEIVELGTRYGIVTPYTSYLATDGSDRDDRRELPTVARRPQTGLTMSAPQMNERSGAGAVKSSKDAKAKIEAETVDLTDSAQMRSVGDKTFYADANGVWTDAELKTAGGLTEVRIRFASDEYFDLVAKEKELAKFFAIGEQVVVVWKGKIYRILK